MKFWGKKLILIKILKNRVLGIEGARRAIINEISKTIKAHSLNVDKRHLILVADILTSRGINILIIVIIKVNFMDLPDKDFVI